jgi:hypothetical protein
MRHATHGKTPSLSWKSHVTSPWASLGFALRLLDIVLDSKKEMPRGHVFVLTTASSQEVFYCTTMFTSTFSVYSAKKFPGMQSKLRRTFFK